MGKQKLTAETLLDKCSNEHCQYNEKSYCHLQAVMIDETGKCIYMHSKEDKGNGTSKSGQ